MKHHTHTTHHASTIAAALARLLPARRFVFALLFALLSTLATSASAAPQFLTLIIGSGSYNATQDQSGYDWTWTASTNTLEIYWSGNCNGGIAFNAINPAAATATINAWGASINGDISCQGTLLVNVDSGDSLTVNGSLAGSLSVTGGIVTISNDIAGSLSVDGGTVKVNGKVGGNLTVSDGVVTINGTVGGTDITGGTVKVNGSFIAGAPPTITASTTIQLNTLTLGVSTSGNGWHFDSNTWDNTLYIEDSLINYTLTGAAPSGVGVNVADTVNGSLTLDGVTINANSNALEIYASNPTVYVRNNNTLTGGGHGISSEGYGVLTLAADAGAALTTIGGVGGCEGISCRYSDLVLQGSGTFNFYSGNSESWVGCAIDAGGSLLLQDSVTVNATAGDYTGDGTGDNSDECGGDSVDCSSLTIANQAKLNTTGGNATSAGGHGGGGILLTDSTLIVTSNAANALVAIGGVGAVYEIGYGYGIGTQNSLLINGTGSIKAVGDDAILSINDMTIAGCKITAEASAKAGYALHAAGSYDGVTFAGGTVFITGGTTTASNSTTPANIYYKTLSQTGGILNGAGVNPGPNPNPDPNPDPSPDHHGGGGAPSLPGLALMAAMLAMRAMKKKSRAQGL